MSKAPRPSKSSGTPDGIVRMNRDRVHRPDGRIVPKEYIFNRVQRVDGMTVAEAREMRFEDKSGKMKKYSGDIAYDVGMGWIFIEPTSTGQMHLVAKNSIDMPNAKNSITDAKNSTDVSDAKNSITDAKNSINMSDAKNSLKSPKPAKSLFCRVVGPSGPHPEGNFSKALSRSFKRHALRLLRRHANRHGRRTNRRYRAPARAGVSHDAKNSISGTDDVQEAFGHMAMKDLPWGKYLNSKHREDVVKAWENEISSLTATVLRELFDGDPELAEALASATPGRVILEFKRVGVWKARGVLQGFAEDKVRLDGIDFNYASDVVGLSAVRSIIMRPLQEGESIGQMDISVAFLQSHLFPADAPPRYLRLKDPVSGSFRYFRQLGPIYGSASAPKHWQETLHPWLVSIGFEQGLNEPCVFRHKKLEVTLATYVDDLLLRGPDKNVRSILDAVQARFKCKEPQFLTESNPLDHLGMLFFLNKKGVCLSMANYIDSMAVKLGMDTVSVGRVRVPFSKPIADLEPVSEQEGKWLMRACGMLGWLAGTGRCDLRYGHSRIAQHMASPCRGAIEAARQMVLYCMKTRDWCLHQPNLANMVWRHYSDSDHAGNSEVGNRRRSQLGFVSMLGRVPICWGSKVSSVTFDCPAVKVADASLPSYSGAVRTPTGDPCCHPNVGGLHADVSVAAAEIYAASVALSEILHLSYVHSEMGEEFDLPINIEVDNATAIAFSQGTARRSKLKHIDVRQQWVQELRDRQVCRLIKVSSEQNLSDIFTKILEPARFEYLRDLMMTEHACPC